MKKAILVLIVTVLFLGCSVSMISAAIIPPAEPNFDNSIVGNCQLLFNETQGTVMCNIVSVTDTRNIYGTLVLYENGVQIDSWIINTRLPRLYFTDTFTGVKGRVYDLVLNVTIVTTETSAQLHDTASKVCY